MNLDNIDFKGVCELLSEKTSALARIETDISDAFSSLETIAASDETGAFAIHLKIEELRFERNKARSEFLDIESRQKTLKRQFFENKFMDALFNTAPLLFLEIEKSVSFTQGSESVEISILAQQRESCYRKLEDSFKDQASMLRQRRMASVRTDEDIQWEARLEHALSRSRQFFSRQCSKIKSIRDQISLLSANDYSHQFYKAAVSHMGKSAVDHYALEMSLARKAA